MKTSKLFFVFLSCLLSCAGCRQDKPLDREVRLQETLDYGYQASRKFISKSSIRAARYLQWRISDLHGSMAMKLDSLTQNMLDKITVLKEKLCPKNCNLATLSQEKNAYLVQDSEISTLIKDIENYQKNASNWKFLEEDLDNMPKLLFKENVLSLKNASPFIALKRLTSLQINIVKFQKNLLNYVGGDIGGDTRDITSLFLPHPPRIFTTETQHTIRLGEEYTAQIGLFDGYIRANIYIKGEKISYNDKNLATIRLKRPVGKHHWEGKLISNNFWGENIIPIHGDFEVIPKK